MTAPNPRIVEIYLDPLSPYAYFGWVLIQRLAAELDLALRVVPVVFGALLDANGQKGPVEIPSKRTYTWKDVLRAAKRHEIPFEGPPAHPFNPLAALRIWTALEGSAAQGAWVDRILRAAWAEGQDISDRAVLTALAEQLPGGGPELLRRIDAPEVKQRLRQNTQSAIEKGVFGVPTFLVEDELFWGHDRIEHLAEFLRGDLEVDPEQLARILARPASAERKRTT